MRQSDQGGQRNCTFPSRRFRSLSSSWKISWGYPFSTARTAAWELSAQGGKLIFSRVEQALSLIDEAENMIAQLNTSATGTIRIGASDMIFEYFLADKIVEYHEKFPAVKIELLSDLSPRTLEALKANRCDVCFVNLPIALDPELSVHGNCMRLTDIFITNEKHIELTRGVIPLARLQDYPLIFLEQGTVARKSLTNFLENVGSTSNPPSKSAAGTS